MQERQRMPYTSIAGFAGGLILGLLTLPYAKENTDMKDIGTPIYILSVSAITGLAVESGRRNRSNPRS